MSSLIGTICSSLFPAVSQLPRVPLEHLSAVPRVWKLPLPTEQGTTRTVLFSTGSCTAPITMVSERQSSWNGNQHVVQLRRMIQRSRAAVLSLERHGGLSETRGRMSSHLQQRLFIPAPQPQDGKKGLQRVSCKRQGHSKPAERAVGTEGGWAPLKLLAHEKQLETSRRGAVNVLQCFHPIHWPVAAHAFGVHFLRRC